MTAIEYLKAKNRMTDECGINCAECPLCYANNGERCDCSILERKHSEKAIEIVEKWAKEHPAKTMKFKVGDRVRVKNCFGGANLKGKIGTVITTKTGSNFYDLGVEFDEPILFGHNCGGLGNEHCCRWGCEIELELIHDNFMCC